MHLSRPWCTNPVFTHHSFTQYVFIKYLLHTKSCILSSDHKGQAPPLRDLKSVKCQGDIIGRAWGEVTGRAGWEAMERKQSQNASGDAPEWFNASEWEVPIHILKRSSGQLCSQVSAKQSTERGGCSHAGERWWHWKWSRGGGGGGFEKGTSEKGDWEWCQHETTAQVRKDSPKGNGLTLNG